MPYKIKMLMSGLVKDDIIEDGKLIERKLFRNEIVDVQTIHESELKANYYRVVRQQIVERERPESKPQKIIEPSNGNGQAKNLSNLIEGMEKMLIVAKDVLSSVQKPSVAPVQPSEPESTSEPEEEPKSAQKAPEKPPEVILDQHENVPEEYMIDENDDVDNIYTEEDWKKGNEQYNQLLQNSLGFQMGRAKDDKGRPITEINRIGNLSKKKMPTVSEAKKGKAIRTYNPEEEEKNPIIFGANGKIANAKKPEKIEVVKDKTGKIDVLKSLGVKLINEPGAV